MGRVATAGSEEGPDAYIALLDQAVIKAQAASYPATTCPVTARPWQMAAW